jgi:hypothetical protein
MDAIISLCYYNLKSLSRKDLNRQFFIISTAVLFVSLYGMWASCNRESSMYLSDKVITRLHKLVYQYVTFIQSFSKLSFDMICSAKSAANTHGSLLSKCQPYYPESDSDIPNAADRLSTSAVLYNILENGNNKDNINSKTIARLLGSVMMNGLPLMGLDDFLRTSDYVNQNLNSEMRNDIMESSFLSGQFGTLLRARNMQIRVSPENCWSKGFVKYMRKSSTLFKVSHSHNMKRLELHEFCL